MPDVVPSVAAAAKTGDRAKTLRALRDRIAAEIDAGVPARDLASLSARLITIAEALELLDSGKEPSSLDSLIDSAGAAPGRPGSAAPPSP